jgi:hypothetical protein
MERAVGKPSVDNDLVDDDVDSDVAAKAEASRKRVPSPRPPVESTVAPDSGAAPASEAGPARAAERALTQREMEILAFERLWWRHAGSKEQAIRDTFDLSATRYYQLLNALLDDPAALAWEPMLVKRLRRLRASRARLRTRSA